jgi:hypothetical protein
MTVHSMLDRREDGSSCGERAPDAGSLRWPAGCGRFRGPGARRRRCGTECLRRWAAPGVRRFPGVNLGQLPGELRRA